MDGLKSSITIDDKTFFMDMVDSVNTPDFKPKLYKVKPYFKILKNKDSHEFKSFISVYMAFRHILPERKMIILNELYGINKDSSDLISIGELLNISPERVRQLRTEAEYVLVKEILLSLKDDVNKKYR